MVPPTRTREPIMTQSKQPIFVRLTIRSVDDDNQVFFSNEDESLDPIEVIPGDGQIFAKVEEILTTMNVGDRQSLELAKEDAFGDRFDQAVKQVPLENLPEELRSPGTQVNTQLENGQSIMGVVTAIETDHAVIDFNHPLAGKNVLVEFVVVEK